MSANDPKQVLNDYLSLPEGKLVSQPDPDTPAVLKDGRWVRPGMVHSGGGMGARAATFKFLKERTLPQRQVHAVTFEDETGHPWRFVCFVAQNAQGYWHFEMGGGGWGDDDNNQRHPTRNHPWANLAGGGWEERFWAGGWIVDNGLEVTRVRLTGRNGRAY